MLEPLRLFQNGIVRTTLWPDERREGRVKYPWRIRLEPIKLDAAGFEELAPTLSFINKRKDGAYAYLVGTPALRRPIPKEELKP